MIVSKASSVWFASDTPTLIVFGAVSILEGILKLKVSDAPEPSVKVPSSDIPSPVNLKYGLEKFCAVAVSVIVPLGFGVVPSAA